MFDVNMLENGLMFDMGKIDALNSATKYPSILTYHALGERGALTEQLTTFDGFDGMTYLTEKIDGCLTWDTRVSMADGSRKAIGKIKVGEEVLGVDEDGRIVATPVINTFDNGRADEWMKIKGHRAGAGRGSSVFVVKCTPNHRFWLPEHSTYRPAEDLVVGDRVTMIRSELELTPCQSSVLLGKLLGDGHLAWAASGSASVTWGHRVADEEYVDWTLRALGDIASPAKRTLTSGYGTEMKVGRSVFHPSIAEKFGSMRTDQGKVIPEWVADALDPIALAFWYMDDGSLISNEGQEDRATFATCGFTDEDCKVLLQGLSRLGVDGTLMKDNRGYLTIRLNATAAERLFLLVAPYVPPAMQRKLPERYRGHDGWLPPTGAGFRELLVEQTIEEIERNAKGVYSSRFDIETGTHNFFANAILVHNSNGRVILLPDSGDYFIGSREELLYARGDRIGNPALGIAEALKPLAERLVDGHRSDFDRPVVTLYLEVYGGRIGGQAKQYSAKGAVGYRLFDLNSVETDVLGWERERISSWRDAGGQEFLDVDALQNIAKGLDIPPVPYLSVVDGGELPKDVAGMSAFLTEHLPESQAGLDETAGNRPEGLVLRNLDRSRIAKARFQDYERTLKRRRQQR